MESYELTNGSLLARITDYGAILTHLFVPDENDQATDVVLGYSSPEEYQESGNPFYYGAVCGRFANRIAGGKFSLDGNDYQLATNNGSNHLHGGLVGFDKVLFKAKKSTDMIGQHLTLTHVSPDGDEGYPGELTLTVIYTVPHNVNEIRMSYHATCTQTTPINLTNHSYFNLNGVDSGKGVLNHHAHFQSTHFTPVDENSIPSGELMAVKETPFDFTEKRELAEALKEKHPQIDPERGYDHNFVTSENLNQQPSPEQGPKLCAELQSPDTGIAMKVLTDQAGFQFYTAGYLDNSAGKGGILYPKYHGFCIETQNLPDAPNKPDYPSASRAILNPSKTYTHTCIYRFA